MTIRKQKHSVTPIFFKATVSILYVIPVQIQCPSLYTNQALLVNSFSRISIYISCCPWREVRMLLAFPLHPFAYFLTLGYLPRTTDNSNFSDFPRRFELSGIDCSFFQEFRWEGEGVGVKREGGRTLLSSLFTIWVWLRYQFGNSTYLRILIVLYFFLPFIHPEMITTE